MDVAWSQGLCPMLYLQLDEGEGAKGFGVACL